MSQRFAVGDVTSALSKSSSSEQSGSARHHNADGGENHSTNHLYPTGDLLESSAATHAQEIATIANGSGISRAPLSPEQSASSASPETAPPEACINNPYIIAHQRGAQERHSQISRQLHSLLPSPHLRGVLARESPGAAVVLTFAHDRRSQIAGKVEPTWSLASADWPLPDTHPVLIARRLMQYAICMQWMPPVANLDRFELPVECQPCELIGKWVGAVASLVANDDEFISSAEGLETLVLLSAFQTEAGHLRRAWVANRRALSFCQLMGVDGSSKRQLVRSCSVGTNTPATAPMMHVLWRRINCADRYLSLILGLPVGSPRDSFAESDASSFNTSLELLEQEHAVICGKIASRNLLAPGSADMYSLTMSIDNDLKRAAGSMDDTWWATPDFVFETTRGIVAVSSEGTGTQFRAARSAAKLQIQHFTLLILLHLPYLLRNDGSPSVGSREACLHASRSILERFLAFRKHNVMNVSGRPIDYSALIAGMTLPLSHLERDAEGQGEVNSDRDLLERTILVFREMASFKRDRLALESADTIHQLLPILSNVPPRDKSLELKVPFLGTVTIKRGSLHREGTAQDATSTDIIEQHDSFDSQLFFSLDPGPFDMQGPGSLFGSGTGEQSFPTPPTPDPNMEDWTFQGIDAVYWSTLGQAMGGLPEQQA